MGLKSNGTKTYAIHPSGGHVFGANLGGNITPIGSSASASTLVAATIIHKYQMKMTFVDFVKTASPFALMQIIMATVYELVFL